MRTFILQSLDGTGGTVAQGRAIFGDRIVEPARGRGPAFHVDELLAQVASLAVCLYAYYACRFIAENRNLGMLLNCG
jgi:hypothetical protein